MCGIFGIKFTDSQRFADPELVKRSTDLMRHRGPDDSGYFVEGSLGLGHRRLSIIDLSPLGHQPMFNKNGSVALVYNGEIYNYLEIFNELRKRGHVFKSRSDTEVIIHAYEEWGFDCVHKFNGMFAFGLWDSQKHLLWLVRDRLGVKPLYYFWNGEIFIFASEIKPILKTSYVKAEINENTLDSFFSVGYVPGPETMFKGINKLLPGHHICLKNRNLSQKMYWDFADIPQTKLSETQCNEYLTELLNDSVRLRLRSDVPLGIFLSGGLDSSAVVSIVNDLASTQINTFTVGYDDDVMSEEPFAKLVADKFSTQHYIFKLDSGNFLKSIEDLIAFAEEPVVEPAAIALYRLSQLAKHHATVLLSGEGSDELFGGYYLYEIMNKIEKIQNLVPNSLLKLLLPLKAFLSKNKYIKYFDWLHQPLAVRYQGTSSYLTNTLKLSTYANDFMATKGDYLDSTFSKYFANVANHDDNLFKMQYVDSKTWLVDDLLLKADKMTMAASIELRVPFLDYRLVEFAASLSKKQKIYNGNGKVILKEIMKNKLPNEIVLRKKLGFHVPINNWFSNEIFDDIRNLILCSSVISKCINKKQLMAKLANHETGCEDNSKLIMSMLVLSEWEKQFVKQ